MRYVTRLDGQKRIFKNKEDYEAFLESLPRREQPKPKNRVRRRSKYGVSRKGRFFRHGGPAPCQYFRRIIPGRPILPKPKWHKKMKFSIIHPSRGRPNPAEDCIAWWCDLMSEHNELEYILSLDSDDAPSYMGMLARTAGEFPIRICVNDNKNVVDAMNNGANVASGDVLLYVSDDFECPGNWDIEIQKRIKGKEFKPWVLEVCDGIQTNYEISIQTILILSKEYYQECGYLYYPEYFSVMGDNDFTARARIRKVNIPAWDLVFKHNHCSIPGGLKYDETYAKENSAEAYEVGSRIFEKRKKDNFGIR